MSYPPPAIGVLGTGDFATSLAETGLTVPGLRLAACYGPDTTTRRRFATRFGCVEHHDFAAFCADPQLQGVIVATPNDLHHDHVLALAGAGKHIFVEKPLALTVTDADRMIATCHTHGVLLAVGHQERRQPVFRRIKQLIDAGELGTVHSFEANHCGNLLNRWPVSDWRFDSARGSGPLLHKGIHKLDILAHLFGPALSVATMATALPFNADMHQTTVSIIRYPQDVIGSFSAGFRYTNASFNVYGDAGSLFYGGHGPMLRLRNERTWEVTEIHCGSGDPLAEELSEFAAAIAGQRAGVEVDGETAREALIVALAAHQAASTQQVVEVDQLRRDLIVGRVPSAPHMMRA